MHAINDVGCIKILHPCFASKATLNLARSLNPIPPSSFRLLKNDQVHQWMPFLSATFCHQNLARIPSIFLQKVLGNKKHIIAYVGIAWRMDLMRTSLPPIDNSLVFQEDIRLRILSLRLAKAYFLFRPTIQGKPKYFSQLSA
ncbi:hypothetical protein V6Z12_D02G226200 [Gossypium hirsutum]